MIVHPRPVAWTLEKVTREERRLPSGIGGEGEAGPILQQLSLQPPFPTLRLLQLNRKTLDKSISFSTLQDSHPCPPWYSIGTMRRDAPLAN